MSTWVVDPDHSVAAFAIRHMMITKVRGQFNRISGSVEFDPERVGASSVELKIDVNSVVTGINKRDDHLKSADFFDAGAYPEITFRSRRVEPLEEGRGRVTGDLTIHGTTREVAFDVEYRGPVKSPLGGETTMGFSAALTLDRMDYGVLWNEVMEGGGLMIDRTVELNIDLEADLADRE